MTPDRESERDIAAGDTGQAASSPDACAAAGADTPGAGNAAPPEISHDFIRAAAEDLRLLGNKGQQVRARGTDSGARPSRRTLSPAELKRSLWETKAEKGPERISPDVVLAAAESLRLAPRVQVAPPNIEKRPAGASPPAGRSPARPKPKGPTPARQPEPFRPVEPVASVATAAEPAPPPPEPVRSAESVPLVAKAAAEPLPAPVAVELVRPVEPVPFVAVAAMEPAPPPPEPVRPAESVPPVATAAAEPLPSPVPEPAKEPDPPPVFASPDSVKPPRATRHKDAVFLDAHVEDAEGESVEEKDAVDSPAAGLGPERSGTGSIVSCAIAGIMLIVFIVTDCYVKADVTEWVKTLLKLLPLIIGVGSAIAGLFLQSVAVRWISAGLIALFLLHSCDRRPAQFLLRAGNDMAAATSEKPAAAMPGLPPTPAAATNVEAAGSR